VATCVDGNYFALQMDYGPQIPHNFEEECRSLMLPLCQAIYSSANPYKCIRKVYGTYSESFANSFSNTSLYLTLAIFVFTSLFSFIFHPKHLEHLEGHIEM
jgi:hypothetical protein